MEDDGSITLNGPKSSYKLPGMIAKMLYPHQSDGLRWLSALHCQGKGGILGDDMGLGKTMQICGFLAGLFHSHLIKRAIIVWLRLTSCQRQLYEAFLKSELVLPAFDGSPLAALTILKKICDHPLLLTKRAAEDVLEGMESMLKPEDVHMAEKLAMHIADVAETNDLEEKHDIISCKIYFILSLLDNLIREGHRVLIFSQTRKILDLIQRDKE